MSQPKGKGPAPPKLANEVFQCCSKDQIHGANDPHRRGSAWTITNMPAEIRQYAIDEPIPYDAKAKDIQMHKDDDRKDMFQKAVLLLQGSEDAQKVFAAQNFSMFIAQDTDRTFKEILPLMENEFKRNVDEDFHETAAMSFSRAIQDLLSKGKQELARRLINDAGQLASSANIELSDSWYKCFENLADALSSADLQKELIPQIMERFTRDGAGLNSKRIAALLIGKLTKRLPEEIFSKKLFLNIETLCKDREALVRAVMVSHLPEIIVKLKEKDRVIPLLNSLLIDEDPLVTSAVVGALGKTVVLLNPKDPKANAIFQAVIPIFKKFVKQAYVDGNTSLLAAFTENMGEIIWILSTNGALQKSDNLWFLDAYLQLSRYGIKTQISSKSPEQSMPTGFINYRTNMEFNKRHSIIESLISSEAAQKTGVSDSKAMSTSAMLQILGGAKSNGNKGNLTRSTVTDKEDESRCRANAAAGFVHFLKFAKPLVDFRHGLHPMVVDLMHDPSASVRMQMAKNIYPIVEALKTEGALLHAEVVYALSDDSIQVVEAIIPNLAEILKVFVQANLLSPENMTNATVEIGGALQFCEERLSQTNDWRAHATILEQLAVLPFVLPGDHVYNNFVPALFHRLLHMRQLPCRFAAADAIVSFLRHCRRSTQREDIRRRIKEGFAEGRSVHDRLLFLYMSKRIIEIFSRKYFREHFFETTLSMADDKVANVRLKAVNMMPALKGALQMSEDPRLLNKLEETLKKIKNSENDRDVQAAIESVIPEMAKIGVVLKSDHKGPKTKEDLEDEAKEREEAYIASLEPTGKQQETVKSKAKSIFKSAKRQSDAAKPVPPTTPTQPQPTAVPEKEATKKAQRAAPLTRQIGARSDPEVLTAAEAEEVAAAVGQDKHQPLPPSTFDNPWIKQQQQKGQPQKQQQQQPKGK